MQRKRASCGLKSKSSIYTRALSLFATLSCLTASQIAQAKPHAGGQLQSPPGHASNNADPLTITADEHQLFGDWRDAQTDPRLAELSLAQKLKRVARSLGVSTAKLQATIARVEQVAGRLGPTTERTVRGALAHTRLRGRILDVTVDTSNGHVVAGVSWRCGDQRDFEAEAAAAAWATGEGSKVIKTLALWCMNGKDTKMFSATIARGGFARIRKHHIDRFAATRYIRLFQDVTRGPHT